MRRFLLYLAFACVVCLSVEGLCDLGLLVLRARGVEHYPLPSVLSQEQKHVLKTRLTTRLLEAFHCAALQHDSLPGIVIYPDFWDLRRHRNHQPKRYEPLLEHLRMNSFHYLDVLDSFVAYDSDVPKDQLTVGHWGHYSQLGNKIVASSLQIYLRNEGLVSRDAIKSFTRGARANGN